MDDERLEQLRGELADLDREILAAAARRRDIAMEIGRQKGLMGRTTRDFRQESEVLKRARVHATGLGLPGEFCDRLMLELIGVSLQVQEKDRVSKRAAGEGRRALVIGGAGRMGRWFARFLRSQGYDVDVADPRGEVEDFQCVSHWQDTALDHDVLVVAVSLGSTADVLRELGERAPRGLIFDVGSLKTPLKSVLRDMAEAGLNVTSIHPMFGPSTELLSGRHVILVNVGNREAVAQARDLFADTMATLVEMDIEEHDRAIAFILGLSHALNITFFTALKNSGESLPRLGELSSTTFDAQLTIARQVASENSDMYYEIQTLNEFGDDALESLVAAAQLVRAAVKSADRDGFVRLMKDGNAMFDEWRQR